MLSFSIGIVVGGFEYPPYGAIKSVYLEIIQQNVAPARIADLHYADVNVPSLIRIHNETDLLNQRNVVINHIWSGGGFPFDKMPTKIEQDVTDERFSDLTNLAQIEEITVLMDYGVDSKAYLFLASDSNKKLVIYHQGHDGDFVLGKDTIQYFLDKNYSVLALSMPLLGQNSQPIVNLPNFGILKLASHDDFRFVESDNLSPIKFFLEPVAVSLNYVDRVYSFESYNMVGISGGGWTTVLYSAIDPRISKSYPVAGSVPMYLRFNNPKNMGDYEQTMPSFYSITDYLDLYIMASYGDKRGQLQIFNKNDPCCFSGSGFETYENEVKKIISNLGTGYFDVFLDETNKKHSISDESLDIILHDMEK